MDAIKSHFFNVPPEKWQELGLRQAFEGLTDGLSAKWEVDHDQRSDQVKACRTSLQHFLRWALTGGRPGPVWVMTMTLLGRDESLGRIESAAASFDIIVDETNKTSASTGC